MKWKPLEYHTGQYPVVIKNMLPLRQCRCQTTKETFFRFTFFSHPYLNSNVSFKVKFKNVQDGGGLKLVEKRIINKIELSHKVPPNPHTSPLETG